MAAVEECRIRLWQGKVETRVEISGDGPPLVFLHGPWGAHDRDFLERLAPAHRIYAPSHPGTTPGDPDAIHQLDEWLDLVVYHGELLDRLGLDTAPWSATRLAACSPARSPPRCRGERQSLS